MGRRLTGLALLVVCCGLAASAPGPPPIPDWLENINPADYVLLQADLPDGWEVVGNINAEAIAQGGEWRDAQGNRHGVRTLGLVATEAVAKRTNDGLTQYVQLAIGVYESPEAAIIAINDFGWEGGDPALQNKMDSAHFPGRGGATWGGTYGMIRYRHMIMHLSGGGDTTTAEQNIPLIMRAWLNKVAGQRSQKWPDLVIPPASLLLSLAKDHAKQLREPAADRQFVVCEVHNTMPDVVAEGVKVQFYLTPAGAADKSAWGPPVDVGTIQPGKFEVVSALLPLGADNLENAKLTAEAFIPVLEDFKPEDNFASATFSVWFAHNGTRAYSLDQDGYSFVNFGVDGRETEEWAESIVSTAVNLMEGQANDKIVWERLLMPQTYRQIQLYLQDSQAGGAGGHCYGMSATSALYFLDPGLRPVAKGTSEMAQNEASLNIGIYHRAQMRSLVDAMMVGWNWQKRQMSPQATFDALKAELSGPRRPAVVEFFGSINNQPAGHAVLGYKLLQVTGKEPVVYVYDPNYPAGQSQPPRAMPQINLDPAGANWSNPVYMGYMWAHANSISAKPVVRTMPLGGANAWLPGMRKSIEELIANLNKAKSFLNLVRCPADVMFVDENGKRTGVVGTQEICEIPNSKITSAGEVDVIRLPMGHTYRVEITSTGAGEISIDKLEPNADGGVNLASFQLQAGRAGEKVAGTVGPDGVNLAHDGQAMTPAIHAHLSGTQVAAGAPPTTTPANPPTPPAQPPTPPAGPNVGDLTICESVVDGVPQNPGETFAGIRSVYCLWRFENLPDGTEVRVVWKRGGAEFSRDQRNVNGPNGSVWFGVLVQGAPLEEGQYEVTLLIGDRVVGRKSFTVTAG